MVHVHPLFLFRYPRLFDASTATDTELRLAGCVPGMRAGDRGRGGALACATGVDGRKYRSRDRDHRGEVFDTPPVCSESICRRCKVFIWPLSGPFAHYVVLFLRWA